MRTTAIVLAAGASSRFGAPKLLADLGGRPVLQHVLDAVAAAGLHDVIVVLGETAADVDGAIAWRHERRVTNPRPADGLASSLRVGLLAADADPAADAAIVLLGDQPAVGSAAIEAVLAAADGTDRPFVRARYARDGAPNPVVIRRHAWPEAQALSGDRGLGPLLATRSGDVLEVALDGANPDVDTPADLERLARREPASMEVHR